MKKNILNNAALALVAGALTIVGCKKEDTTSPEVTAPADETISLQDSYTQQNGTATDDKDGELTVTYSGTVDVNQTGTYTITFTATDAAGNVGTAEQKVTVINDADAYFTGSYSCYDTLTGGTAPTPIATYTQSITASSTINNRITFSKFGGYSGYGSQLVYGTVTGNSITVPSQTIPALGGSSSTHTFNVSTGSKLQSTATVASGTMSFKLIYADVNVTTSQSSSANSWYKKS